MQNIIKNNISEVPNHVENSYHLVEKLNGICFGPNYKLASLDVISLFMNVPIGLALESICKR